LAPRQEEWQQLHDTDLYINRLLISKAGDRKNPFLENHVDAAIYKTKKAGPV
jgi:hypothetical protein